MDDNNRPDLEGNDETANRAANHMPAGSTAAAPAMAADAGAGGGADLSAGGGDSEGDKAAGTDTGSVPYYSAGREFTHWFNSMLTRTPNPVLKLGTKTARVEALLDDGRLQVQVEGAGGRDEQQFVAFEGKYIDALLLKFASAARAAG